MKKQTIQELAQTLYDNMGYKEFPGFTENSPKIKKVVITAEYDTPIYKQLLDVTFQVQKSECLSMDSVYKFTCEALGVIADSTGKNEDEIRESIYDIEGDVYTSDLTEWLDESNYHVEYITEALQEYGEFKDGFALLNAAQATAKKDVGNIVLDKLIESVKELV